MDKSPGGGTKYSEHGQSDGCKVDAHRKSDRSLYGPDRRVAEPFQIGKFQMLSSIRRESH